jgi:hypothetical protein
MPSAKPVLRELREGAQQIAENAPDVPLPHVEHATIAEALVAALAGLIVVERSGEGNYGSYADLADLGKVAKPALARHGMTYMQDLHAHGDGLAVTTTLLHASGEQVRHGPLAFPHGQNAQATGSYITYMRRYSIAAALGLAPGDSDDDGAAAKPRQAEPPRTSSKHPLHVEVDALEDGARLWAHFLGQAAVAEKDADALLAADEGWRKWLTGAIKAHKPAGSGDDS